MKPPNARILIVEDEVPMRTALDETLTRDGYRTILATNGDEGLRRALEEAPDLILLDVMMPRRNGFQVAEELRRRGCKAPILMLTAKGFIEDRVRGLNAGADDYLVKPFSAEELMARIRSLLRRWDRVDAVPRNTWTIGRLEVDFSRLHAASGGIDCHLSPKEWAMLRLLLETPGAVVSRERFLDVVWGVGAYPSTRTVDTHIGQLRAKIEPEPDSPRHLVTIHRVGYRLDLD